MNKDYKQDKNKEKVVFIPKNKKDAENNKKSKNNSK
jgi:hypothetical protein